MSAPAIEDPRPRWQPRGIDLGAALVLGAMAVSVRLGTLPYDGLWFDDSWVAAGAVHGRPSQLLTVGSAHPAFTGLLMLVDGVSPGSVRALGVPSLVAGVLGPPLLYAALRLTGTARSVALVLGAALAVAPLHILYSGRVKGYTLDVLLTLLLVMAVVLLAGRTWKWWTGVLWVVGAVAVGTFSGYAVVAAACAAIVLVLHPAGDRAIRVGALVEQAIVQLAFVADTQRRSDLAGVEEVMEVAYDGHLTLSWNPLEVAGEWLTHLGRVAQVYPGGPSRWWTLLGCVGVAGLLLGALAPRRRAEALACRALLLMVAVATVGGFLGRFPFGPTSAHAISAGGRHTLWLLPALAFGLAAVAARARDRVAGASTPRAVFDGVAVALALAIFLAGRAEPDAAPSQGSESATRFIDETLGPDDVALITGGSPFAYALSTDGPVNLKATPSHQVGFTPDLLDPRVYPVGVWAEEPGTDDDVRAWADGAERVFVMASGSLGGASRERAGAVLSDLGFMRQVRQFESAVVDVWTRPP